MDPVPHIFADRIAGAVCYREAGHGCLGRLDHLCLYLLLRDRISCLIRDAEKFLFLVREVTGTAHFCCLCSRRIDIRAVVTLVDILISLRKRGSSLTGSFFIMISRRTCIFTPLIGKRSGVLLNNGFSIILRIRRGIDCRWLRQDDRSGKNCRHDFHQESSFHFFNPLLFLIVTSYPAASKSE